MAKKWYDRAVLGFAHLDIADAELAVKHALQLEPQRESVKVLAAKIALSQLRFEEAASFLEGVESAEGRGLRARALWYSGQIGAAADALDRLLDDPDVKDPWAEGIAQLARSGAGREPFRVTGALLAVVEMARVPDPTLIVPLELNGEPVLAMVATGRPEVVVDTAQQKASWVSLRFDRRLEVKDVPALSADLSSLSRRLGAPIKLLLGAHLLRRLNVTFDFYANQFVVRSFEPPPPPSGTVMDVSYIKGGGMVVAGRLGANAAAQPAAFLVDTAVPFPLAMGDSGWEKARVDPKSFEALPGEPDLKQGLVPRLGLGSFELPRIPGVRGLSFGELAQPNGIVVDGVIGAALMAEFRVSLANQGRSMWLEEMPAALPEGAPPGAPEPPAARPESEPSSALPAWPAPLAHAATETHREPE